jgi:transcriptional regulator with XRE-family HTH domain
VAFVSFSHNLNRLMKERGWSSSAHLVAALADIGVNVSTLSVDRWRQGERSPHARTVPHIAKALGVELTELFAEHSEPTVKEVS